MKVVQILPSGCIVDLFQSDDIDEISAFLDANRLNYPRGSLFVDFGHR